MEKVTNFRFVIKAPNQCILWQEDKTIDLSGSAGAFSVLVGSGTNSSSGSHSFSEVFNNSGTLLGLGGSTCSSPFSYTPALSDDRTLEVSFNDGSGVNQLPEMQIKNVPFSAYSSYAQEALRIFGKIFGGAPPTVNGQTLVYNSSRDQWEIGSGNAGGTVVSVDFFFGGGLFSVQGGPITTSGTLTSTLLNQSPNTIFAGPSSGSPTAPTFRILERTDIPPLPAGKITDGTLATSILGVVPGAKGGTITQIDTGIGIAGGPIITVGTISLQATGIAAGTVGSASFIPQVGFDIYGRIVSMGSAALAFSNFIGTLAVSQGGTGVGTNASNGQLLIGNGSGFTLNTLNSSNGILITNSEGTINVATNAQVSNSTLSIVSRDLTGSFAANKATLNSLDLNNLGSLITLSNALGSTYTYTFPPDMGLPGQVLQTNGTSNTSWVGVPVIGGTMPAADGSAGTPAISFSADPDTGMYRLGNNLIGFSTAGTSRLTIGPTGSINISASIPSTSSNSGALTLTGGLGVGGAIFSTGSLVTTGPIRSISSDITGNIIRAGAGASTASFSSDSNKPISFIPDGTERMRISVGGSVGIGTSIPVAMLDVNGNVRMQSQILVGSGSLTLSAPLNGNYSLRFPANSGTTGQVLSTDGSGTLGWISVPINGEISLAASGNSATPGISFTADQDTGISNPSSNSVAIITGGTTRLTIDSGGNLGIGTLAPAFKLDVAGDVSASGCLRSSAGVASGMCVSDQRLKTDVKPFELGLSALVGITPRYFKYNGLAGSPVQSTPELGLIAQEVEKSAPQLVTTKELKLSQKDKQLTVIKQVNYTALTYVLINAVKSLYFSWLNDSNTIHSKIELLNRQISEKTENAALQMTDDQLRYQKIRELETRLEHLEKMLSSK